MAGRGVAYVGIGISCLLILAALALPSDRSWTVAVLGGGVLGLSLALVFLQLSYWREGEARSRSAAEDEVPYEQIIGGMDSAIATGFRDVGFVDPQSLSVRFKQ